MNENSNPGRVKSFEPSLGPQREREREREKEREWSPDSEANIESCARVNRPVSAGGGGGEAT